jgi:uncharacterized FlaG/YvyC family protein
MVTPISSNLSAQLAQNVVAPTTFESEPSATTGTTIPKVPGHSAGITQPSDAEFYKSLNDILANTGFRGEVDTTDPNQVIIRIVDDVTGATVVQMPSATALAVAEALRKSAEDSTNGQSGALLDAAA